jgi:hypothetical protein
MKIEASGRPDEPMTRDTDDEDQARGLPEVPGTLVSFPSRAALT